MGYPFILHDRKKKVVARCAAKILLLHMPVISNRGVGVIMRVCRDLLALSVGLLCAANGEESKKCGRGEDLPTGEQLRIGVLHRPEVITDILQRTAPCWYRCFDRSAAACWAVVILSIIRAIRWRCFTFSDCARSSCGWM